MKIERFKIDAAWPKYRMAIPDEVRIWATNYRASSRERYLDKPTMKQIYLRLIAAGLVSLDGNCCQGVSKSGRGSDLATYNIPLPPDIHGQLKDIAANHKTPLIFVILAALQEGYRIASGQTKTA